MGSVQHRDPLRASAMRAVGFALLSVAASVPFLSAAPATETPVVRDDQRWRISLYATDAGLQRQNIFSFDFAADGTVWVAASGGLYQYGGYRWKHFGPEDGLPSHFARSVLVDHTGRLWIGTDKGVGTFDGKVFDRHGSDRGLAGPSVRRMVEDPDGTIWFCSDRWPDASVGSGLTSYHDGVWKAYTTADGLAGDHVYNYFRDSHGRRFAMTVDGVSEFRGDRWGPPADDPVGFAKSQCWSMAEVPGLGVVARSSTAMYVKNGGPWRRMAVPSSQHTGMCPLVFGTREGEIVTCDYDGTQFAFFKWNGTDIVPISPPLETRDHSMEFLRQAPDGALWYCAYGTISRWERGGGEWTEYLHLPFPRVQDRFGHIWFADDQSAFRLVDGKFEPLPDHVGSVALDRDGNVWNWNTDGRIARVGTDTRWFSEGDTGLRRLREHTLDIKGNSWFDGEDASGARAAAVFDGRQWTHVALPGVGSRRVIESSPDPVSGVWYLTIEPNLRQLTCVHAELTKVEKVTTDYGGIVYLDPHLCVDQTGALWISGQAGMYRLKREPGSQWEHITAIPGNDVGRGLVRGEEIWFPYNGWTGGESGYAVFHGGTWRYFTSDFSDLLEQTADGTLYVGIEAGLNIVPPRTNAIPTQLTFPAGQRAHTLVKDKNGDLWTGVVEPDGTGPTVFRYRADGVPPQTDIVALAAEVRRDRPLVVKALARSRFVPNDRTGTSRYSWRFDDEPWSPFQILPADGLSVAQLKPGVHRLQLRSQDEGLDVDPQPVSRTFAVLPIPLQERAWFKPAVLAVFAIIVALAVLAAERARRFARANVQLERAHERLEERVAERTAELSQSNRQLADEVAERKRAQSELESVQGRLVDTSRRAGMAEVATSVLHNVGNVLNSVNVTTNLTIERIQASKVTSLEKLAALLAEHTSDLGEFFTNDPRGRKVPEYISKLAEALQAERLLTLEEMKQLRQHVDHMNQIVAMQQTYAKISGVVETVPVTDLVEDALRMNSAALDRHGVTLVRDFQVQPLVTVERHKVLQILVNLIRNAKYACDESQRIDKVMTVQIASEDAAVLIRVIDNGIGIPAENLTRIFGHGFTTRKNGHGFGLHSGALTAKELGGSLTVGSAGTGHGATFTLKIPIDRNAPIPPSAA